MFPLIASLGFFILLSNYLGMIPGFFSPTANINTTAACALIVVVTTHVLGVKFHGAKYVKHFMGPVWWLTPLIMPIELIGHLARVLSLSIRLFGNVFGEETGPGDSFLPGGLYLAPLPMMFLGLFTGLIQAFILLPAFDDVLCRGNRARPLIRRLTGFGKGHVRISVFYST